ncbi:MAG: aspartate aminotransferase family protein [Silvanigrellales bacterium]|nr:aspartate aminotransferase family protein [Silvanigrellales bacterium]
MMTPEEFRRLGHEAVDWIADYHSGVFKGPVMPRVQPGDILNTLEPTPPLQGEPGEALLRDFKEKIVPGLTHWNDPRFMGYFPCNNSLPSVLGEILTAGIGVNTFSWLTSPAGTELEILVMRWLGQLLDLPWQGVLQDTASTATLCALLSAREHAAPVNAQGSKALSHALVCYVSDQGHSSILKAARIAGIGDENVRMVPSRKGTHDVDVDALSAAMMADVAANRVPFFVTASVGTTATTAVDDVVALSAVCKKHGAWLHVDAALAGSAAILPEMRWLMAGVADADSFVFNPHKWLFTNFDCTAYFCKDPDKLKAALALTPEYLKTSSDGVAENFRDWGIPLGRRFRALKLWFVLRSFGVDGLQEKLRLHLAMAKECAARVEAHPRLTLAAPVRLNTVTFFLESDAATKLFHETLNATGEVFLTHARVEERYVIRVSFGQTRSDWSTLESLWALIEQVLKQSPFTPVV